MDTDKRTSWYGSSYDQPVTKIEHMELSKTCSTCGQKFSNASLKKKHIQSKHSGDFKPSKYTGDKNLWLCRIGPTRKDSCKDYDRFITQIDEAGEGMWDKDAQNKTNIGDKFGFIIGSKSNEQIDMYTVVDSKSEDERDSQWNSVCKYNELSAPEPKTRKVIILKKDSCKYIGGEGCVTTGIVDWNIYRSIVGYNSFAIKVQRAFNIPARLILPIEDDDEVIGEVIVWKGSIKLGR